MDIITINIAKSLLWRKKTTERYINCHNLEKKRIFVK